MIFSGVFAALTTPYASDGSVSLPDLKHNVQQYNQTDLAGYVAVGSTGESVLLSRAEMDGILVTVKEVAALAEHPNIIGIKDSSGNVQGVAETIAATPPKFQVLVGSAGSVYP